MALEDVTTYSFLLRIDQQNTSERLRTSQIDFLSLVTTFCNCILAVYLNSSLLKNLSNLMYSSADVTAPFDYETRDTLAKSDGDFLFFFGGGGGIQPYQVR